MWFLWFVSVGVLYVILLYLIYLKQKDEKRRLAQLKVEEDVLTRVNRAIKKEEDNPKEEKDFRDLYVFDKDKKLPKKIDKIAELEAELERLKKRGTEWYYEE